MRLHLVIIEPAGYIHSAVFHEVAELYTATLQELGHDVSFAYNHFKPDALNLLFGYQLMPLMAVPPPEYRYVVLQFEQLGPHAGIGSQPRKFANLIPLLSEAVQIWDFCPRNVAYLARWNLAAKILPLGFHPVLQRIPPAAEPDVDVLFFGTPSPHRAEIIDNLTPHCRLEAMRGCYGQERDSWISRSKIVLNLHTYPSLSAFEQVRVFYLLSQPCFVISEASEDIPYHDGLIFYEHQHLVAGILSWLDKPASQRRDVAERGLAQLKALPFRERLAEALSELEI